MRWTLRLAALLIAGCSDGGGPSSDEGDAGLDAAPSDPTLPAAAKPLPPVELANQTLDFTTPAGGVSGVVEVQVPAGYGNLSVAYQVLADCPVGYANDAPRLLLQVGGSDTILWSYTLVVPAEPYACSPASMLADRERALGDVVVPLAPGVLAKVTTAGQFSGEVRVVVTALA